MFELLRQVHHTLEARSIPHALIGAGAMSVVGYVRSTQDLDLLVTDEAVLEPGFWEVLVPLAVVEVFDGREDWTDPLAGVVRVEDPATLEQVDVVVGKHPRWQRPILKRAVLVEFAPDLAVPVADAADLVLLKLFAGSPHDENDIRMLLSTVDSLIDLVDRRVDVLPARERDRWLELKSSR